jgi:hypothetical protein
MTVAVQFRLKCLSRHDEQAGVHVGYIPALKVFSQVPTAQEKELPDALVSAAQMFIITCYERDILETLLKERGMTKAVGEKAAIPEEQDYISVSEYQHSFTVDVPVNLVAASQLAK